MIPKTIHYCWFGGNPKPKLIEKCMKSWQKHCPDFEIIEWNEDNFEVSDEEVNIGISVRDGNTELLDAMNKVLDPMDAAAFNALMAQAVAIQPIEE